MSPRPRFYLMVKGIFMNPNDYSWAEMLSQKIESSTGDYAGVCPFFDVPGINYLVLNRRIGFVEKSLSRFSQSHELIITAHSHGSTITCEFARKTRWRISKIHIFAGACDSDMDKNGLNEAMRNDKVGEVYIYRSPKDPVLKTLHWARKSKIVAGALDAANMRFRTMGYTGPGNVAFPNRVHTIDLPMDHNDWFNDEERLFNWVTV